MRPGNRTPAFLRAYRITGSVKLAAKAAGVSPDMHTRRMRRDPAYAQAFAQAHQEWTDLQIATAEQAAREAQGDIDRAEEELYRRAVYGWEEPLTFQGQLSHKPVFNEDGSMRLNAEGHVMYSQDLQTINKKSDRLLEFYLKGARPDRYRERHEVKHSGSVEHKFAGSMSELLATFKKLTESED